MTNETEDVRFTLVIREYPRLVSDWENIHNRQLIWTVYDNYNEKTVGIFEMHSMASMVCDALNKYLKGV